MATTVGLCDAPPIGGGRGLASVASADGGRPTRAYGRAMADHPSRAETAPEATGSAPARPGDRVEVRSVVDGPARRGEVLEVLGRPGHWRYRVRWDEEHESILFPADGCHFHPAVADARDGG